MMPAITKPPTPRPDLVPRYSTAERLTHWAVALAYVALFLSGLALFHPFFFWTSALFGGAAFMRVLHPFLGVALVVLFYPYALRLWKDNVLLPSDRKWLGSMFAYMNKRGETFVEGKYNAGQKLMYWSMVIVIAVLALSGIALWRPFFSSSFSAGTKQLAAVVHAFLAFVMFVGIGVHVYAAYWTKGSMRAMTRGSVTRSWARFHHPGWAAKTLGRQERP
ncbi:formate dehydrogenase subunit gamma [Anaeromyxobacter oryzae]|uniref:Formate dehydrogenase cytochrome b556 subunit n=1 Tax=Anaeromyxobacter oryzae TaxID=2918170 RepID=A0ABM7WT67_9BACT|nr:formate dehydrogenase subunit gamma [Anaeromyxobacter oryzae]BDG02668.1 formate dehydrogenase cytochrome b556 subunit [Anaeromyxobacter oryzae]